MELLATASAMDFQRRLSPELWIMIFRMLSKEFGWRGRNAIGNVRLTCRLFESLATPFLLTHIFCAPLSRALTRLTAVSCHPVLSRSIKEVTIICNRYQSIKTLPEYKDRLRLLESLDLIEFEEPESEEENLDMETAFSQYGQRYNDQAAVEESGEVIARLCSALMRMPNVEKITISPNSFRFQDEYDDSRYFVYPWAAYNQTFLLMARALSIAGANIQELDIETDELCRPEQMGVDGAVFRGMSDMDLSHCCNAFRGLRDLTIAVGEFDIDGWMTGNMAKILSAATNLESLWFNGCGEFHISLKHIFSTTIWSRLTSLNLDSLTLDQGELLDLLRRHSGTLKEISLSYVTLVNGSWRILLEGMKSSLSLEAILIYETSVEGSGGALLDDIYVSGAALEDYLLRDGPHPLSDNIPR